MATRKKNPIAGICRIDQPAKHNHGFLVRLRRNHKIYSGHFADAAYGGKKRAFAAAQDFLRELRGILGPVDRKLLARKMDGYNKSGITGVSKIVVKRAKRRVAYWLANWSPKPYVIRRKYFSVAKYGARKAKQMAIRARAAGVKGM